MHRIALVWKTFFWFFTWNINMHTQTKSMHLKWHQLRFQQNLSISTGIIAIKHWPYKANFNIRISPKYQWWFFFRMRPAAMLRCAGAAAIPQLLGMGWSGLCGVPGVVRAWYIPAGCGPLSAQERHTDMLGRHQHGCVMFSAEWRWGNTREDREVFHRGWS